MTAVGSLGWLAVTGRPDIAYAHSRVAQHMALPTEAAWVAVTRILKYLKGTSKLSLFAPCEQDSGNKDSNWALYTDSDHGGNDEPQNKLRSQCGFIAMYNDAPVLWGSKVSTVSAHANLDEAHVDLSSAASEIYAAATSTQEFMHLQYMCEEMNIKFPKPFTLQLDNTSAEMFIKDTVPKARLKHIDKRLAWVKMLRDKRIMVPAHVPTTENLADIFTKILPRPTFQRLRSMLMKDAHQ